MAGSINGCPLSLQPPPLRQRDCNAVAITNNNDAEVMLTELMRRNILFFKDDEAFSYLASVAVLNRGGVGAWEEGFSGSGDRGSGGGGGANNPDVIVEELNFRIAIHH